jgi:hypothetical protein
MAQQIVLVRDTEPTAETINLHDGSDGFRLARSGWVPSVAQQDESGAWPKSLFETMTLNVSGANTDTLASYIATLNTFLRRAKEYDIEPTDLNSLYLKEQLPNEDNERRAYIKFGAAQHQVTLHSPPVEPGGFIPDLSLTLERKPFWEPGSTTTITKYAVATTGGIEQYGTGTAVPGDVAARISRLKLSGVNGGGGPLYEAWIGFYSNRYTINYGTSPYSQLETVWKLEEGTESNNTAVTSESDAIGGAVMRWTPAGGADNEMLTRVEMAYDEVSTTHSIWGADAMRGRFLILLRAKCTSTRTFRVRMQTGYAAGSNWRTYPRQLIDKTSYYLYPLGTIDVPGAPRYGNWQDLITKFAIRIQAEEAASGSGNLDLGSLIWIPQAEGGIYIKGASIQYSGGVASYADVTTDPYDNIAAVSLDETTNAYDHLQHRPVSPWALPMDEGLIVVAAQRETQQVKNDTVDLRIDCVPRWLSLRGAA